MPPGCWIVVFVWVIWCLQLMLVPARAQDHRQGEACSAKKCGNLTIADPFWLTDWRTGRSCGPFDFEVNCTDNSTPVLRSYGLYGFAILNITYAEGSLHVVDEGNLKYLNDSGSGSCRVPGWNTSGKLAPPFRIGPGNLDLVFYNCTAGAAAEARTTVPALVQMGCGNTTFVKVGGQYYDGSENDEGYHVEGCTPTFLPVLGSSSGEVNASEYRKLISNGFLLTWQTPPRLIEPSQQSFPTKYVADRARSWRMLAAAGAPGKCGTSCFRY